MAVMITNNNYYYLQHELVCRIYVAVTVTAHVITSVSVPGDHKVCAYCAQEATVILLMNKITSLQH